MGLISRMNDKDIRKLWVEMLDSPIERQEILLDLLLEIRYDQKFLLMRGQPIPIQELTAQPLIVSSNFDEERIVWINGHQVTLSGITPVEVPIEYFQDVKPGEVCKIVTEGVPNTGTITFKESPNVQGDPT